MFYLYLDRELIAVSEKFSEVAEIILVELIDNRQISKIDAFLFLNSLFAHDRGSLTIPGTDSVVEVYRG